MTGKATTASRSGSPWARRLRNGGVLAAVLVALYALLGFLVLPSLAKPRLEAQLTQRLGRQATLGRLELNPFTFHARLRDFALTDRDPRRPFFRFATLDLDVSLASVRYLAPVLDAIRLERPQIDVTRNADGGYSIDDLIERRSAQRAEPAEAPAPQFSLNNIEVVDGSVSLDDVPHRRKIVVSNLAIGLPFLSSIPHDAKIRVTPRFEGAVDGARFGLAGNSTSPFADTREATLEWNLDALPLAGYAEYVPLPGGMKLTDGVLTTRLKLTFVTDNGVARTIALSGAARVDKPALARKDGSLLVGARSIDVAIAKLDALQRSIALDRVVVDAPRGDLLRGADGTLEWASLAGGASPGPAPREKPWTFSIAQAEVRGGAFHVSDRSVTPPFDVALSNVGIEGRKIASAGAPGSIELRFDVDDGAHVDLHGEIDIAAQSARGHASLKTFHLAKLYPYYADAVNLDVRGGTLDLAGDFTAGRDGAAPRFTLTQGAATLHDLETALRGERDTLWKIARLDLNDVGFDLAKRSLTVDRAALAQGSIRVVRERDGAVNFERLVRKSTETAPAARASDTAGSSAFSYLIRRFDLERVTAEVEDRAAGTPVKLRVSDVRASLENLGSEAKSKAAIDLAARVGAKGRLRVKGTLVAEPLAADWRIESSGIDLVPLRPYFEQRTNVVVTRGSVGAKGQLVFKAVPGAPLRIGYKGDVTIGDFASLDRPTSQELMRWSTLTLTAVDAASEPFNLALGSVAMDGFYARLILSEDAKLNLKQLLAPESAAAQAEAAAPARTVAGVTTKELPPPATSQGLPVSIGRIELSHGEVQYSDFFVKPNYTAHLTEVSGSVSALSASQAGSVGIAGRVEGTAPFEVRGTLNPFARDLQLDLTGKASDVDLPPLTPYSVKYAGYGIQKGKLSLEVHYRIDDRKLAATNKLRLDQLTFGEHVDSPTATKLPVLLAVSLLKDRNGVINLDLPIAGTLDDPKFSVWGVLVQIFVNLITKAVTAPFALLGAIAGGGGEQLAYIEFAPGHADLSEAARQKLATLAKALTDRPALKIDAGGRAVPGVDREGLQRATLDRALRVEKQKTLAGQGESAPPLESLAIDAAEYPKLLTAAYRNADLPDKPRNMLGIAKTIPPAEMEALLLASYRVDDEALATLANRRAQVVKEWFVGEGAIASERVFVVAPKLTADGIDDKGAPTRVDFSIR